MKTQIPCYKHWICTCICGAEKPALRTFEEGIDTCGNYTLYSHESERRDNTRATHKPFRYQPSQDLSSDCLRCPLLSSLQQCGKTPTSFEGSRPLTGNEGRKRVPAAIDYFRVRVDCSHEHTTFGIVPPTGKARVATKQRSEALAGPASSYFRKLLHS